MKRFPAAFLFLVFSLSLEAAEYTDGRVKLVIHESTGRFSLYFLSEGDRYEPFFSDQDPRTSFLAVMVNYRSYRLGESPSFKTSLGGTPANPALIFESPSLIITQDFSFIKTGSSPLSNGVRITITIANQRDNPVEAGARLLIDTNLGEKSPPHFYTNQRQINTEALIDAASGDRYWVSKSGKMSLKGILTGENAARPDFIHIANWKRLNDTPWKISFAAGRNFNQLPYSVDDSAVCYYYEPAEITRENPRVISVVLASEDESPPVEEIVIAEPVKQEEPSGAAIRRDMAALKELVAKLDEYIASGVSVTDEELAAMELAISRIKNKYGIP